MIKDKHILHHLIKKLGPTVFLPNNESITSTASGYLPIPQLSPTSNTTHILPGLKSSSLLSLGQICDDNCIVQLTKSHLYVFKNNKIILTGYRNSNDGLWDVPLPQSIQQVPQQNITNRLPASNHHLNVIIRKSTTKRDLAQYYHACAFSPSSSTFIKAIRKGHFITWPGLTGSLISKFLPPSIFTAKGHLNQEMKHLQSTNSTSISYKDALLHQLPPSTVDDLTPDVLQDFHPTADTNTPKTYNCFATITDLSDVSPKQTGFMDLTGKFPYSSSRGNNYFLVIYDYDSNAILVELLKNRQAETIVTAWKKAVKILERQGIQPKLFILDNEISADLKSAMELSQYIYQLVPPDNHRKNAAERAIQTWKNHFIAGIASLPGDFPMSEWDRLVLQGQITLLLLRSARTNPNLSSYAYLYGNFDFNKTPLAPPGIKVLIHNRPSSRRSWGFHGEEAFYVAPALQHYRCIECYVPKTRATRISDTVTFLPTTVPVPETSLNDHLRNAASDLVELLKSSPPTTFPSLHITDTTRQAINDIAILLRRSAPLPSDQNLNSSPKTIQWKNPLCSIKLIPKLGTKSCKPQRTESYVLPSLPRVPQNSTSKFPRVRKSPTPPFTHVRRSERLRNKLGTPKSPVPAFSIPTPKSSSKSKPPSVTPTSHFPSTVKSRPLRRSTRPHFRSQAATYLLAQHIFQLNQLQHSGFIYNDDGTKASIDNLLNGKDKIKWDRALSNEVGRLAQGNSSGTAGTDTIEFIPFNEVPSTSKVTYANFVCTYRPKKPEPWRIRLVAGGDKLHCNYDTGSPAASLLETKLLLNSVISDAHKGAQFMTCDLKDFFLATPMQENEYMRIHIRHIPQDIKDKYDINSILHTNNYVYVKIKKGMYGLKQAAVLAYNKLVEVLKSNGYNPCPMSTGIWSHKSRRTKFCVCVDDFGIKYFNNDDADHLLNSLKQHYQLTIDYTGNDYCGLTIDWNYHKKYVDISMPGYLDKVLQHHETTPPLRSVSTPHPYSQPVYGKHTQYATPPDTSSFLSPKRKQRLQAIIGSLLYYARAIDGSLLPAINEISASQASPTTNTETKVHQLLAFAKHHQNTSLRFYASDMRLHVDSDAAYLVMPGARSRIAGYYHLSRNISPNDSTISNLPLNGAFLIECKTIRHVVASAAEAETAGLFLNAQNIIHLRQTLSDLGHPQPPTPLKTDNTTANDFVHANMKRKRSKSWDMRYHWLRDKTLHNQVHIFWDKGSNNNADYYTKHHAPQHHRSMRSRHFQLNSLFSVPSTPTKLLHPALSIMRTHMRGCVSTLPPRGTKLHTRAHISPPSLPITTNNKLIGRQRGGITVVS